MKVVVVGGGITGLAAAWEAARSGATVTLLDRAEELGGKLRTSELGGRAVDESADAFLARVPDGVELCRELGIDGELVSPAARRAYVYSRGALRPLPEDHVLGVPTDLEALRASGIVSPDGVAAAARDLDAPGPPPRGDETIGAFVRRRLGDEVLERLVDPLVGGINAGDTDVLSLAATVPQLDAAARSGEPSLVRACAAQRAGVDREAPVFLAPVAGMGRLVSALVDALEAAGVSLRTCTDVVAVDAGDATVHTATGERLPADATIVTTPTAVAARQLRAASTRAATLLAAVPTASVALVTLVVSREAVDHPLDGSGFLVPRPEGRLLTACSWASSKWAHLGGDDASIVLRASAGRFGDDRPLALDDGSLVRVLLDDLADTMALHGAPTDVRVSRWPESFPQYLSGHLDRVAAIEEALAADAPSVRVTGAGFRGLGVPACIRQGREAARAVLGAAGAR